MRVNIANISSQKQQRWATVALPFGQGPKGQMATFGQGYLAVKGPSVGQHSQLWDVFSMVRGKTTLTLDGWQELQVGDVLPKPKFSDWIEAGKLIPRVTTTKAGGQTVTFQVDQWAVEFVTAARIRFVGAGMGGGFHARVWADVWVWQDAIDLQGFVGWSDQADPTEKVTCSIELSLGEPFSLYLDRPSGFELTNNEPPTYRLLDQEVLIDGCVAPFRGVVVPTDKTPATVERERTGYEDAAREGPLVATCEAVPGEQVWDGNWLAYGKAPAVYRNREAAWTYLERWSQADGSVLEVRPLANAGETGRTGDQACFGATKDLLALSGDSLRLYEMQWSADDYLLRGIIRFEPSGAPVVATRHPEWLTWSGLTDAHNGQDKLGKAISDDTRPYGWDYFGPGSARLAGVDDQHRGDLYIQSRYALTGDPILREQLRHHLQTDRARSFRKMRWLDAPRAAGRLMLSWANSLLLLPEQEDLILDLAMDELTMWEPKIRDNRQVQWLSEEIADTVLPGLAAAMPWHDALMVLGTLAMARSCRRVGRPAEAARFLDYSMHVSSTCLRYGTLIGVDGVVRVCNGVQINGDGSPMPPEYYTFPRQGAVMAPTPGSNLLVGDPGWAVWWSAVIRVGLDHLDGLAKERAQALDALNNSGPLDLHTAEWLAL